MIRSVKQTAWQIRKTTDTQTTEINNIVKTITSCIDALCTFENRRGRGERECSTARKSHTALVEPNAYNELWLIFYRDRRRYYYWNAGRTPRCRSVFRRIVWTRTKTDRHKRRRRRRRAHGHIRTTGATTLDWLR